MKYYRVKPEFIYLWGADVEFDTEFSLKDIEWLAEEWEMTVDELMEQVYEI